MSEIGYMYGVEVARYIKRRGYLVGENVPEIFTPRPLDNGAR